MICYIRQYSRRIITFPQADDGFVGPGGATREQLAALTAMLQQNPEMSRASALGARNGDAWVTAFRQGQHPPNTLLLMLFVNAYCVNYFSKFMHNLFYISYYSSY